MKKIWSTIAILAVVISTVFAQAPATTKHAKTTKKTEVVKTTKSDTKAPVKKDGTPDKRYSVNKTKKSVVHVKKDGTADKRYKENK